MRENKTLVAYISSALSAIITLVVRLLIQDALPPIWSGYSSYIPIKYGIDSAVKPYLTIIPIVAAVICAIMIFSSKKSKKQKSIAGIISAILIILSVLFIWINITIN